MNRRHPATYSKRVLDCVRPILQERAREHFKEAGQSMLWLDPMAGTGKAFLLEQAGLIEFECSDLDPDWEDALRDAAGNLRVKKANALQLPWPDGYFDGIFVSPVYANRMGDHHEAKDPCSKCKGTGSWPEFTRRVCPKCKGSGLSPRNTYFHRFGRELSPGTSCYMQWDGDKGIQEVKEFHLAAWREASRVAKTDFVLNVSNHIRNHEVMEVAEWHRDALITMGWTLMAEHKVKTPRNRFGANGEVRVANEFVYVFRR